MERKETTNYEKMAADYLAAILEEAQNGAIQYLSKEEKENGDIEIITTFWGPTVWLDLKEDKINFNFSYSPFEYSEGITNIDMIEKIKQAI